MSYKKIFFCFILLGTINAKPLDIINFLRLKSGAAPLKYNKKLAFAAKKHALYVSKTQELGHYEADYSPYFYGRAPWDRILKSGFGTAVVIENISFFETSFKASIQKIMDTVYHRLAFLYLQADSIGYASVGKVYVYEMSNSKIVLLCRKHYKNGAMIIEGVCPNRSDIIPEDIFNKEMYRITKKSKGVIIYPYRNQKGVPLKGVEETPKFHYGEFGYPITITFNSKNANGVALKSFQLFRGKREVAGEVVSSSNDIHKKIRKGTFVFVPQKALQNHTQYKVKVVALVNGKRKVIQWSFETR